jgi:hypothetical protein
MKFIMCQTNTYGVVIQEKILDLILKKLISNTIQL